MKDEFLVFGKPNISDKEIEAATSVIKTGWLGTGPKVMEFTSSFKEFKDAKNVQMLNSCTSALHIALLLSNVKAGDEIITTSMTFAATVNSIIYTGATAVLVDIEDKTGNIDIDQVEDAITENTKAILAVHFAGYPLDIIRLRKICDKHGLLLIEDCAHAIETVCDKVKAGTMADYSCFSFYSTKNIGIGEGGALICKNEKDAEKAAILSLHGMSRDAWKRFSNAGYNHYDVVEIGYKYNMMDIQAAIGIEQLKRINEFKKIRTETFNCYDEKINNSKIRKPFTKVSEESFHAKHLYIVRLENEFERDSFLNYMNDKKIGVGVHYRSITEFSIYKNNPKIKHHKNLTHAIEFGRQCVSLPISNCMTKKDMDRVTEAVNRF